MPANPLDKHFRMGIGPPEKKKRRVNKDGSRHTGNPYKAEPKVDEIKPAGAVGPATAD